MSEAVIHGQAEDALPKFFAIDFFCGAGGTTQGLIQAGGYVIAGVDKVAACRETYERNNINRTLDHAPARYIQKDIFLKTDDYPEGEGEELLRELGRLADHYQKRYPNIPLMLAICAPCQPFTQMTRIEMSDERAMARLRDRDLLGQTFRFVEELRPNLILSENVAGIQNPSYGGVWQDFSDKLKSTGYVVGSNIVDTAHFQVPQHRKRSIMLAVNKRDCLKEAIRSEGTPEEHFLVPDSDGTGRLVSVRDAIGTLPPIKAGETHETIKNHAASKLTDINLRRIRLVQPGQSNIVFGDHGLALPCHERARTKENGQSKAFNDIYTRMSPDRPSPTITTKCTSISNGRFGHFDMSQDRAISVREAASLQTFPLDYEFFGAKLGDTARMVGNAVPPKLSEFFGTLLIESVDPAAAPFYCAEWAEDELAAEEGVIEEAKAA